MFNWFRKPADTDMQTMQVEPRTEEALDKVAAKYKNRAELWQRVSLNGDKLRLQAIAERDAARDELELARAYLRQIAALETPGSAPAAKRMARIAREALPEYAEAASADRRAVALARLAENDAPYIGSAAPAR